MSSASSGKLHIDFETRSILDLTKVGGHNYSVHESTGIWCMAWAFSDGSAKGRWAPGQPFPKEVARHVAERLPVAGWNVMFEYFIWNNVMTRYVMNLVDLRVEQLVDTMAKAYAAAFPGGLDQCAVAMKLPITKDREGHKLMMQMCRPRRIEEDGTPVWWDDADRQERLGQYCDNDVVVEMELDRRLRALSDSEQAMWVLDQRINLRGIPLDMPAVRRLEELVAIEKTRLGHEMAELTDGAVTKSTQSKRLKEYVQSLGVETDSVDKAAKRQILEDYEGDEHIVQLITLAQESGKTSVAKFTKMRQVVSDDDRARMQLQFHAAGTGRWGGRGFQPHNMPRPTLEQYQIEYLLDNLIWWEDALDAIDMLFYPTMDALASCARGVIAAPPGRELISGDWSAIESRKLAWLAGQEGKLEAYRTHGKVYELQAMGIYNLAHIEDVTKAQRLIGKVAELALGYQGGVGAFQSMAAIYGVKVTDAEADAIKHGWREANPQTVQYWYKLEEAAMEAIQNPGWVTSAGPVQFVRNNQMLWCKLPSGRLIAYPFPAVEPVEVPWGTKTGITYWTVDQQTRKWVKEKTFGGKLAENVTQASCADILREGILAVEGAGYPVIFHVHDEPVSEVEEGYGSTDEYAALMARSPRWAPDLPLAAEAWRGKRYRK